MAGEFRLELMPPAQRELEEIARLYLALSGPQSARRITDALYAALEQLERFPYSGPALREPELRSLGYRCIVAGKYVAVYRVMEKTVVVYHIFDGRSDYPALFKGEVFSGEG